MLARLRDGRLTADYPIKMIVRLNRKQMVAVRAMCGIWGSPEAFCYGVIVSAISDRWNTLTPETKKKIADTPYRVPKRKHRRS